LSDQPRVPAGSPEGGQWAPKGGLAASASHIEITKAIAQGNLKDVTFSETLSGGKTTQVASELYIQEGVDGLVSHDLAGPKEMLEIKLPDGTWSPIAGGKK
jgi:hypothetical protein